MSDETLHSSSEDSSHTQTVDKLWRTPFDRAVLAGWRLPDNIRIAATTNNPEKLFNIQSAVAQHSAHDVIHASASEEDIQSVLRNNIRERRERYGDSVAAEAVASGFVSATAMYKALSGCDGDTQATHVFGFDTDIVVLNAPLYEPFGKPNDHADLMMIAQLLSDNFVTIHTAGALARVEDFRVVAFDEVIIFLKFKEFSPIDFISAIGEHRVGQTSGGVDFSDHKIMAFVDPKTPITVNRTDDLPVHKRREFFNREVRLTPSQAPAAIHDVVKGAPKEMVRWLLYNGIANPTLYSPIGFC